MTLPAGNSPDGSTTRRMNEAILVLNRRAGRRGTEESAQVFAAVCAGFRRVRFRLREVDGAGSVEVCRQAVANRAELVVVVGGDGTVSGAAGVLAGTETTLGVVPFGTLNHFARDLRLPADWREAIPVLATGRVARVDVGELNGRVFVNNCSLGAYADAVRRRDALRLRRGVRKWPAMALAAAVVFFRLRRLRLRGVVPSEPERLLRTPFVVIANNRYSGHVFADRLRDRLDDGRLWIYTTRAHRHLSVLRLAWQTVVKRIDLTDTLENWPAREITIVSRRADARIPVALDGEVVPSSAALHLSIRPAALRVLVGPGFPA